MSRPQAERSHLQQKLGAIEARVSESARDRANLSRRLAETAVEAEQAEVTNQRLQIRVRVRRGKDGGGVRGDSFVPLLSHLKADPHPIRPGAPGGRGEVKYPKFG